MESRKRKRYGFAVLVIVFMIGTTSCKSNTSAQDKSIQNQAGKQMEDKAEISKVSPDVMTGDTKEKENFSDLLERTDDIEELYAYIEDNAEGATKEEWEEWITGVAGFGESDTEYGRFQEYRGEMSEEMKSFIELMSAEQLRPSFDEEGIQLTLGEILDRCIAMEQHIEFYGEGDTYSILYPKYCQLVNTAITGGYDEVDLETNEYLEDDKKHIRTNIIEEYEWTMKDNPDTRTAEILKDYLEILKENDNIVNENIEKFYNNIYNEIDEKFS